MANMQSKISVSNENPQTKISSNCQQPKVAKNNAGEFFIKIANTLEEREAAFRLGYRVYIEKGYINENSNEWLIQNYDFEESTVILIVQDKQKNIVGSVTLVFDGEGKLPAEKIYQDELNILRSSGFKMAELSRLVINPEYRNSKEVITLLFNYLCIYIHHVKSYNCLTIEVNPRHKDFYNKTLSFDEIGDEKSCPQVKNAPAVLLYMPTTRYQSEVKRCSESQIANKKERSFFQYFLKLEQESLVVDYLKKQAKPMSSEEKLYFGYSESGISRAVPV